MAKKIDWLPFGMLPLPVTLKAWKDPQFAQDLISDPIKTLTLEGYTLPTGNTITVQQNTDANINLVLPQKPMSLQSLDDDELIKILGPQTKCGATGTCS